METSDNLWVLLTTFNVLNQRKFQNTLLDSVSPVFTAVLSDETKELKLVKCSQIIAPCYVSLHEGNIWRVSKYLEGFDHD